ncbi:hypothetical protein FH972_023904 [Carpinus fangiana]|uniref:Arb2 domain-containing protein n=1 Tax=Carpinus fangiana TaxID=176857 RepID=A0A5N6KWJ3_9ROSI|nr:hypothetical protein FH972_023904 [Carpinus fangiana]
MDIEDTDALVNEILDSSSPSTSEWLQSSSLPKEAFLGRKSNSTEHKLNKSWISKQKISFEEPAIHANPKEVAPVPLRKGHQEIQGSFIHLQLSNPSQWSSAMSQFRSKVLDIGCYANARTIRDHTKRKVFAENEPLRQALRHMIRNTTLPQRTRAQAQLKLSQMHAYTRSTQFKNRCTQGGRGRGIMSDFKMFRFAFRIAALQGNIPGLLCYLHSCCPLLLPNHIQQKSSYQNPVQMFRRLAGGLPRDPQYSSDLAKLGFGLLAPATNSSCTDCNDRFYFDGIRFKSTEAPNEYFRYFANDNERHNEVRLEAFHTAVRRHILEELKDRNIIPLYLPQLTREQPLNNEPSIPILTDLTTMDTHNDTERTPLNMRSRVVVIINQLNQDLAIFSHRMAGGEAGPSKGSMIDLVDTIRVAAWPHSHHTPGSPWVTTAAASADEDATNGDTDTDTDPPGIIILNSGQICFSNTHPEHPHGVAMTPRSWLALPRPSGLHEAPKLHAVYNRAAHNASPEAHLRHVFSPAVLGNPAIVHPDARMLVIAIGDGADETLRVLSERFTEFGARIGALAMVAPSPTYKQLRVDFLEKLEGATWAETLRLQGAYARLLARRARAWSLCERPLGAPIANARRYAPSQFATGMSDDDYELVEKMAGHSVGGAEAQETALEVAGNNEHAEYYFWPRVSGGEAKDVERVMPTACGDVVLWLTEVERHGDGYVNPTMNVPPEDDRGSQEDSGWSSDWSLNHDQDDSITKAK